MVGRTVIQLCGRTVIWSYGCTVIQSYGHTVVQSYSRTVLRSYDHKSKLFRLDGLLLPFCIIMGLRSASSATKLFLPKELQELLKNYMETLIILFLKYLQLFCSQTNHFLSFSMAFHNPHKKFLAFFTHTNSVEFFHHLKTKQK